MKNTRPMSLIGTLLSLLMVLTLTLTGCSKHGGTLDKIKQSKTLFVGTSADYPPFEFEIVKNGKQQIVGYDVLLAHLIAKDLGVKKVKVVNLPFPSLINELQDHKVDLVIAGMVYTKQRAKIVNFSQPNFKTQQSLLVATKHANKFKQMVDLKGQRIGAQQSSEQETIARAIPGAKVVAESSLETLTQELKTGSLDGLVVASTAAQAYVVEHPHDYAIAKQVHFRVNPKLSDPRIISRKGDTDLLKQVNQTIARGKWDGKLAQLFKVAQQLQFEQRK